MARYCLTPIPSTDYGLSVGLTQMALWRLWLIVHSLGLGSVAVLFIGGLAGQMCPALVGQDMLKSGPFAYGDGTVTEGISLVLTALFAPAARFDPSLPGWELW